MKLPGIAKGAAQRLVRQDVNAPLAEANARMAAFNAVGGAVSGAFNRYQEREDKRQVQEATLAVQRDQIQFERDFGSKVEFNVMDPAIIDNANFTEALGNAGVVDINQKVPAYRIMPELRAKNLQDSFTRHSEIISSKDVRENWVFDEEHRGLNQYLSDSARASQDQIRYSALQTAREVEDRLEEKDYDGARLAILTADMGEPDRQAEIDKIDKLQQEDRFDEILELRDLDDMELALKQLNENDKETTSQITNKEQRVYANYLRGAIKDIKNVKDEAGITRNKLLVDEAKKVASLGWDGKMTNPKRAAQLHSAMETLNPLVAQDLNLAMQFSGSTNDLMKMDPETQQAYLVAERDVYKDMTTNEAYVFNKQMNTLRQGINDRKNDALEYGKRWGIVDFEPINYENIGASVNQRMGVAETMQDSHNAFTGYLEKSEVPQFAAYIESQDTAGKLEVFQQVYEGMNGDVIKSARFFEQFKTEGEIGTAAIAGQVMSEGATPVAKRILEGATLRRNNPQYVKDIKEEVDDLLVKQMGSAFRYNNIHRNLITESVLDAYAYSVHNDGINPEKFDRNTATTALKDITGGIVQYNGSYFQAPMRGMTQVATESWLEDLSPAAFSTTADPAAVKRGIINGDYKLVGTGQNKFRIVDGGQILQNKDGSAFVLSYDPDYPSLRKGGIDSALNKAHEDITKGVSKPTSIWESDTAPMIKRMFKKWGN